MEHFKKISPKPNPCRIHRSQTYHITRMNFHNEKDPDKGITHPPQDHRFLPKHEENSNKEDKVIQHELKFGKNQSDNNKQNQNINVEIYQQQEEKLKTGMDASSLGENSLITQDSTESDVSAIELDEEIEDIDNNLPPTAVLLTTEGGSKVYVVGTVHFSLESQKDVAKVIRSVQPNYIVLELCSSRGYMLHWNEEKILEEAQNLNYKMLKKVIQSVGFVQGSLYLVLLSISVRITKQLGIAPGGEFRTAYREARNVPNCTIWFGDRPVQITLQRMLSSLSLWQMLKLGFIVLFKDQKITKEEVDKCRDRDVLERMILGFSQELPEFARVTVDERDAFLTYCLQLAAEKSEPNKVVGVVGIGHLPGIKENWGKVSSDYIQEILKIPPPSRSSKIIKFTLKFSVVGLVLYGVHRLASKSSFYSNLFSDDCYWSLSNLVYDVWDSPVMQN